MKPLVSDFPGPGGKLRRCFAEEPPAAPTPDELDAAAVALADWQCYPDHLAVARALGVSPATLTSWKEQHPRLLEAWEKAAPIRAALRRKRKPLYFDAQGHRLLPPAKRARLAAWFLVNRVDPWEPLTEDQQRWACERANLSWEDWKAACQRSRKLLADVRRERARRAASTRTPKLPAS